MFCMEMEAFWDRMFERLYVNPGFVLSVNDECMLYKGRSRDREGYGRVRYTVPGIGREKETSAHRMSKMIEQKSLSLELDASHICHNKLCINTQHISMEENIVNNNRKACVARGTCVGHVKGDGTLYPECRLNLKRGRL